MLKYTKSKILHFFQFPYVDLCYPVPPAQNCKNIHLIDVGMDQQGMAYEIRVDKDEQLFIFFIDNN